MTTRQAEPGAIVLGSAAGGGFPQWNCGCHLCRLARINDPRVRPATQAGIAVSGDGESWLLLGASPDLRQQLGQTPRLWPRSNTRDSPIIGVVLTGGDIDAIAGLLVLRERHPFTVYGPASVLGILADNDVFKVLDPAIVRMQPIEPGVPVACGGGMTLTLVPLPGKVPLYRETPGATEAESGSVYAAMVRTADKCVVFAPGCAVIDDAVLEKLSAADVLFFDGTLFTDDEMIRAGLGTKTGTRMGHSPVGGPDGTLVRLANLPARRILLHINNTNPIWLSDSPERKQVEDAGFEVAFDGMEVPL